MDHITVVFAFLGTFALFGLAFWLWRLASAKPDERRGDSRRRDVESKSSNDGTVFLPRQGPVELAGKLELSRPEATEFVPAHEAFMAADRARMAEPKTELVLRPEPKTELVPRPEPKTEQIPREQILAMAGHRASSPGTTLPTALERVESTTARAPEPAAVKASPPELPVELLTEHFEAAVRALRDMTVDELGKELTDLAAPQRTWQAALDLFSIHGERSAQEVLLPVLRDEHASEQQGLAAALALLQLRGVDGSKLLLELGDVAHGPLRGAVQLWPDERAENVAMKCLGGAEGELRLEWLEVFGVRASDPGAEILAKLLESSQPERIAAGLRLLPLHAGREQFVTQVDRYSSFGSPVVRREAIVAGLVLRRPAAWMLCKQASRVAESAELRLILSTLGSNEELASLISWAEKAAAPKDTWWALGLSGRVPGIESCLSRTTHADAGVRDAALAGFRAATGARVVDAEQARTWWRANETRFDPEVRHLGGLGLTSKTLATVLRSANRMLRSSIGLELLVRSKGAVRLPTRGLPDRMISVADGVMSLDWNLQKGYAALN